MTQTITPEQRDQFLADGVMRAPAAIPTDAVEAMAARIWNAFTRQVGFIRDRPETWTGQTPKQVMKSLVQMSNQNVFAGVLSPGVRSLLDHIFGERGWQAPRLAPRPLGLLFPTPDRRWSIPTRRWHLDRPAEPDLSRPAAGADRAWPRCVRLFAYLGAVEPGGGGTFYVSGSHRAVNLVAAEIAAEKKTTPDRIAPARLVGRLKAQSDWIGELCSREAEGRTRRFMEEGGVFRGIPLRVGEMTGQPGDVILWRPNLLHTPPTANIRGAPRLVLSATVEALGDGDLPEV